MKGSIGSVVKAIGKMKQGKSAGLRELQKRCSRLLPAKLVVHCG